MTDEIYKILCDIKSILLRFEPILAQTEKKLRQEEIAQEIRDEEAQRRMIELIQSQHAREAIYKGLRVVKWADEAQ